jgi:hypothetical protein
MNLSLDDILVLLVHLYSLAGDRRKDVLPAELEERFKSLVAEILVNDCDILSDELQDFGINELANIKLERRSY